MSDDNKFMELSAEELDIVAGGAAASLVFGENINILDTQTSAVIIGKDGGIASFNTQQFAFSKQTLNEIKFTGNELPGIPSGFFSNK